MLKAIPTYAIGWSCGPCIHCGHEWWSPCDCDGAQHIPTCQAPLRCANARCRRIWHELRHRGRPKKAKPDPTLATAPSQFKERP
jgi:hypothetical protein